MNYIEGICFFGNKKNIPTDLEKYRHRTVFTTQEGKYIGILIHASSHSDKMMDLWKQCHRIVVNVDGKEFEQTDDFKCHRSAEENVYIVVGCIDWNEIFQESYANISITITMGRREVVFISEKLITVLPLRMANNEIVPMDMYLTDKECISLEAEMVDKYSLYGFDQDESFKAHVWLVCRNNFNETVNDNLLAEVEFKCCHETHGLIDRELVYGIDIPGNRILFKGGFSIGTWPEGTYKIKAYLWGTQIAETVCVIGSRSMHGKYPFTNLITKEKLSVVKKKKSVKKGDGLSAIEKINSMIGMDHVKKNVIQNLNYNKFVTARKKLICW